MRFPNAFKGVKKIWLAELLLLLAAVLGIVLLVIVAANSTMSGEQVIINEEAVKTPAALLGIGTALIALVAFLLNLIGLINARKDDSNFNIALAVTLLGIVASVISSVWSGNKDLVRWMDTVMTICSLFASYFVLTGIASLADAYPDPDTKAFVLKSRTWLEGSFCATALFKLIINIFNIQEGSTISTILGVVALLLELISYILFLRALGKGKKMLAA